MGSIFSVKLGANPSARSEGIGGMRILRHVENS